MKSFKEMALPAELQKALSDLSFVNPTPVQEKVLPIALDGRDFIACAETGSGKTGAYGIPLVKRLLESRQSAALILAPTRELAHQIADFIRDLTKHCQGLQPITLVGGADMKKQLKGLKKRPRIIVATPGRLIDHLKRRSVRLNNTSFLVLDEGDRMLDMGFSPQLDEILEYLPKERQTSLFTATLPKKVQKLAEKYLTDPQNISVGRASLPAAAIKQSVVELHFREKDDRIVDELNKRQGSVIVFLRTKSRTDTLAKNLKSFGFAVDLIHGGRTQGQRNKALQNFRKGRSRILCATDIAARGLDVPHVEHVINFDLPMMSEDYVHRIGRTARNGNQGEAVSFVTPEDRRSWQSLARRYEIPGAELTVSKKKTSKTSKRPFSNKPSRFKKKTNGSSFEASSERKAKGGFKSGMEPRRPKKRRFGRSPSAQLSS